MMTLHLKVAKAEACVCFEIIILVVFILFLDYMLPIYCEMQTFSCCCACARFIIISTATYDIASVLAIFAKSRLIK